MRQTQIYGKQIRDGYLKPEIVKIFTNVLIFSFLISYNNNMFIQNVEIILKFSRERETIKLYAFKVAIYSKISFQRFVKCYVTKQLLVEMFFLFTWKYDIAIFSSFGRYSAFIKWRIK